MDGGGLQREIAAGRRLQALTARYGRLEGEALLEAAVREAFPGRIAAVSSFGAESAVLLWMLARIAPATPVIFLETGKHFPETLAYRDRLVRRLGLTDVRSVAPRPADLGAHDGDGGLWRRSPDLCCHLRKVLPLERALAGFEAWVTGRKRFQAGSRAALPLIESEGGRIKVNPLANWSRERVQAAYREARLPVHPLAEQGYASIGCAPCTRTPAADGSPRSGRWAGLAKSECGIHRVWWARRAAAG